jgi:signal transduction histidine kinase/CheY-like chemotaxis protein
MNNIIKALEYITIGTTYHDKEGKIIYANPVFCKLFRTNNKDSVNKLINDDYFCSLTNNKNILNNINNNIANIHDEILKITYYNEYIWIRVNSITIKNGVDYYILTYENISDSHNISYLYENIFNNINMGVTIVNSYNGEDFFVKDINPFACKLNNILNKNDVINKNLKDFELPIINGETIFTYIKKIWNDGKEIEIKSCKCLFKNIITWRNFKIIKVETGEIIILFEDITNDIIIKEKLEQSDKYKSIFLSNMSHEIRSPVNSIVGFSDMLHDVKNNERKLNEYIDIIKNSSKSLMNIIDDVLDFSKIEAGKLEINKKNFSLNEILEELYLTNKNKINTNTELKITIPPKGIKLLNDEFRFRQIFNNLINNAIKFTTKGYIEIGYDKKDDYIEFFVKDTGQGINESEQNKLFDRFLQSKSNKGNLGHGLGLSISKELVNLMGGDIRVISEFGKGSEFYFTLPNNRKIGRTKNDRKNNNDYDTDFSNKTIFIVEDIEFNIKLLKSYLEETNSNIIVAEDGNDALIKYNENKNNIDLILMDIQLPEMNGTEVTKIIRTIDTNTPIIAQTAYAMRDEVDDIMSYGFDDLIKKPIRKEELLKIINKYI